LNTNHKNQFNRFMIYILLSAFIGYIWNIFAANRTLMRNVVALHIFSARKVLVDRYNNNNLCQSFAQLPRRVIHVFNVAVTVKKKMLAVTSHL
jgi:hypothetical protein